MSFVPDETVHDRITREAFTVVSCAGGVAVLSDGSARMVGDLTRPLHPHPHRRVLLLAGECSYCDTNRGHELMPPHDASLRCESGKRSHCTCDTCF